MNDVWHIVEAPLAGGAFGECDRGQRMIRIDPAKNRGNEERLDTLIHELLHIECPRMVEARVRAIAGFLSQALHDQGYRRTGPVVRE